MDNSFYVLVHIYIVKPANRNQMCAFGEHPHVAHWVNIYRVLFIYITRALKRHGVARGRVRMALGSVFAGAMMTSRRQSRDEL